MSRGGCSRRKQAASIPVANVLLGFGSPARNPCQECQEATDVVLVIGIDPVAGFNVSALSSSPTMYRFMASKFRSAFIWDASKELVPSLP
eukprot:gene2203-biopygen11346